jgi:CRISPR type I-E-associated protein CasB/Cse2
VNDPSLATPTEAPRAKPTRRNLVAALRHAVENADPGTLAALRRFKPGSSPPAAFYRVTVATLDEHLPEDGRYRDQLETRWAVIAAAIANAKDFLAAVPLGKALAEADVAELRVIRLLEAQGAQLADLVRMVVHQLVQKGQMFDLNDLADIVLSDGESYARDSRRRVARDFYRHDTD